MNMFSQNFRIWWQRPRKHHDKLLDRSVSFLELFYDIVYVFMIAQIDHVLTEHLSLQGFLVFSFLFLMVWVAWFNGAAYHDLHGNNDIRTRIFTFLQMFAVAGMALFAPHAIEEGATGFALSYAFFLLVITFLWWRTGVHDKAHSVLSLPHSVAYLFATVLMLLSAFIKAPTCYYLWALSLFCTLFLPVVLTYFRRNDKQVKAQIEKSALVSPALVERFGLFIIIVLGEFIIGIMQGLSHIHHLNITAGLIALLGMGIAIGLWWLYFDLISPNLPHSNMFAHTAWAYLHLPLTIGIATIGVSILNIIESTDHELLMDIKSFLVLAICTVYVSIVLISGRIQIPKSFIRVHQTARVVILIIALLSFSLLFIPLDTIAFLFILWLLMLAPIITGLRVWIKQRRFNI